MIAVKVQKTANVPIFCPARFYTRTRANKASKSPCYDKHIVLKYPSCVKAAECF